MNIHLSIFNSSDKCLFDGYRNTHYKKVFFKRNLAGNTFSRTRRSRDINSLIRDNETSQTSKANGKDRRLFHPSNMALFPVRIVLSCMIPLSASISNVTPCDPSHSFVRPFVTQSSFSVYSSETSFNPLAFLPAKRDPLQIPRVPVRKNHPRKATPPSRVPSLKRNPPTDTQGIKISSSSATSLFSQLRNPSNARIPRIIALFRGFPSKAGKRSPLLMSAAFRDSSPFPLPFLFLISSAPFPFLTSHQERRASVRPVASSSPSLQIMRTSCAANKTRVAPPPRVASSSRKGERERGSVSADLLSRRNNEVSLQELE